MDFYKAESKQGHQVDHHHYTEPAILYKPELVYNKKPKRQILRHSSTNTFVTGFLVNLLSEQDHIFVVHS